MDRVNILQELRSERDRVSAAIAALEGSTNGSRKHTNSQKRTHGMSPEGRRRLSEMLKKRWAQRRKAGKTKL